MSRLKPASRLPSSTFVSGGVLKPQRPLMEAVTGTASAIRSVAPPCVAVICAPTGTKGKTASTAHMIANALLKLVQPRSEEHTSELQSLMRISYAVFCLKKNKKKHTTHTNTKPYITNK